MNKMEEDKNEEVNVDDNLTEHTKDSSNLNKYERKLLKRHQKEEEYKNKLENENKKEKRKSIIKYSAIAVIILIILVFVFRFILGISSSDGSTLKTNAINIQTNAKVKGDLNAPVTIIEYSDFECPFCKKFFLDTLPLIDQNYIKTGKVKFVYKNFPLRSIHFSAQIAAEASECANEQGKFWEYHNLLFQNAPNFRESNLINYATQLELNINQFSECLKSGKYKDIIEQEIREGSSKGVRGTPGFLINGKLVSGAQPFSVFEQIIESYLN